MMNSGMSLYVPEGRSWDVYQSVRSLSQEKERTDDLPRILVKGSAIHKSLTLEKWTPLGRRGLIMIPGPHDWQRRMMIYMVDPARMIVNHQLAMCKELSLDTPCIPPQGIPHL